MRLEGNPLECACFNLDFVRWLWQTSVSLDGEGHRANYTCTTETGEISSTEQVMAHWMEHWRRCVGGRMLAIAMSAFLTQVSVINTNTGIFDHDDDYQCRYHSKHASSCSSYPKLIKL